MTRGTAMIILSACMLAASLAAEAQQATRMRQIGLLGNASTDSPSKHLWTAFREGLRDLGYVEGQNIVLHARWPADPLGRWSEAATELVRLQVEVIVAANSEAAAAAKQASNAIPIVMISGDPLSGKLIGSLTQPGGNVTGISTLSSEIIGKQLQLLKEVIPALSRVAILRNPNNPFHAAQIREVESAARVLGMHTQVIEAASAEGLEAAFSTMAKLRAEALLVLADAPFLGYRTKIADLARKNRLPTMYPRREHVLVGGLIAYGTDRRDLFRRLATYVDKILKGAKPADLPVEQPTRFELVVNVKAANALALPIPPSLLQRADDVIQ